MSFYPIPIPHTSADGLNKFQRIGLDPYAYRATDITRGCLATESGAVPQQLVSGVTSIVTFDSELYDTDNIHDLVTNKSRLTVPSIYSASLAVRLTLHWGIEFNATGYRKCRLLKNGGFTIGTNLYCYQIVQAASTSAIYTADGFPTPLLTVVPGDYFEMDLTQDSGVNLLVLGGHTWMEMQLIII